jgi:energy-coupling factor transporter ATP-binding protein EcfA2
MTVIEVRGLDVRYAEAHALRGVDVSVEPGSFLLIGGPSGGGKSTLAHVLMGLVPNALPAEVRGHVLLGGVDPRRQGVARMATRAGLVFQNPATQLFNGTVEQEVAFGPRNLGLSQAEVVERIAYSLEAVECAHLRHAAVRHLSSGEQQRVAIAAALAMRPAILILDEPTANLDTEGVRRVVGALVRLHRRFGATIIVIEHRLEPFLPHADRLVWLDGGRVIADGPPAETLAQVRPDQSSRAPSSACLDQPLVSLQGIAAGYDGRAVLRDCSLALRRGELAALVGANGSGKSTLARVLAGVLRPQGGRVVWHGDGHRKGWRVGFLQQNPLHQLVCDTVEDEIRFGPLNLGTDRREEAERVLAQTDLLALRRRPTRTLSVGEQQRAALGATLSLHPELLILDEPTVGQDWDHLIRLMDSLIDLNGAGQTILLITHERRLVERYAGRVWVLQDGEVRQQAVGEAGRVEEHG